MLNTSQECKELLIKNKEMQSTSPSAILYCEIIANRFIVLNDLIIPLYLNYQVVINVTLK